MLKSPREIEIMCESAEILKKILAELRLKVREGISTSELDEWAEKRMHHYGAQPAFKGYRGFPASICASVNETVVHGIPSKCKLREGDIVSIDVGVIYKRYYSDAARTWPVGKVDAENRGLIGASRGAFEAGLAQLKVGKRLGDVSHAIQEYAESRGYSVVRDFVGHGIGLAMHEDPQVPNYGEAGRGIKLEPGLVIAIEPMINAGSHEVDVLEDRWTVVTRDGKRSSHFENTVALTENGVEVLTAGSED